MSNHYETEPFLARWSRRKRELAGVKPPAPDADHASLATSPPPAEGQIAEDTATQPTKAEPPLDLSKLPRLEDLTADTDITAFLDRRVPAPLRNAVLSRMWTLDPTIRDFIEVAELQWDWNSPAGAPFYELMEPGSAAGTLIGDASSAITRALRGEAETPAGDAVTDATAGDDTPRKIEQHASDHIASQHPSLAEQDEPGGSITSRIASDRPSGTGIEVVSATQHTHDRPPPAQRRHGGALPT